MVCDFNLNHQFSIVFLANESRTHGNSLCSFLPITFNDLWMVFFYLDPTIFIFTPIFYISCGPYLNFLKQQRGERIKMEGIGLNSMNSLRVQWCWDRVVYT